MKNEQKILIVDDDPKNLRILEEILSEKYELLNATSGEEALKVLSEQIPDLILLDIMMPGLNGYEVCKRIRSNREFKYTRIILVSGKAMVQERLEGYKAGADDYVTKPFVLDELSAKVAVFMKLTKVERELHDLNTQLEEKIRIRTEQLLQAERKAFIGIHTAEIAHDMSNPLALINLNLSVLVAKYPAESKLVMIRHSVERIVSIIRSILQAGTELDDKKIKEFSLNEIIESELKLQELDLFFKKQVRVEKVLGDLPLYRAQISHFQRWVGNLIKNSIDALHGCEQKKILISTKFEQDQLIMQIKDTGCGISAENLKKIFDPFFTTKSSDSDSGQPTGTGLGLPSVKRMLEAYGGSIEFESELGVGTTVTVKLPSPHLVQNKEFSITQQQSE